MTTPERPDAELVAAARNGDADGFTELYHRHYAAAVGIAYSTLSDRHLAEDAAQEAFAIVCRDLARLRRDDNSTFGRIDVDRQLSAAAAQRKRTSNVARPKIFRPADFAATITTPERVAGSNDLIRPLNSMSAPSVADTIAGADSRTA